MRPLPARDLTEISERARADLDALEGAHVLITGATGFIGSWLWESATYAMGAGARVTFHARRDVPLHHRGISPSWPSERPQLCCDIREITLPPYITHVIHCASACSAGENTETPDEVRDIIVAGTAHIVAECKRVGVQRLLHLSSGSVYACGIYPDEHSPRRVAAASSSQPFARAKMAAEDTVFASGVPAVVARVFALIGPRLGPQFAVSQFLADAIAGRPIMVAHPDTVRGYLYAADLTTWLWALLVRGMPGLVYNVGNDQALTMRTVARYVATCAGVPVELRDGMATRTLVPHTSRARETLGLEAWTDAGEALARTWAWLRGAA